MHLLFRFDMFTKGHTINLGRIRTQEVRHKLSLAKKGNKNPQYGLSRSAEWKQKMSDRMTANHPMKGKHHSVEAKAKMSAHRKGVPRLNQRGENAPAWKGGTTAKLKLLRCSLEYRLWREAVFKRDDFKCQMCSKRGGRLNADHIKPFALFPELRFAIDNGRTLCHPCHKTTPTYGWRMKSYQVTKATI